jgi:pimeloyl-ACP methyl ester carboxylesterase
MIVTERVRRVRVWQDRIEAQVNVFGDGPPLVYLHGPWGLRAEAEFLHRLGQTHTVFAPLHPGTNSNDPEAIHRLDTLYDLVVYYGELLDHLRIGPVAVIGHSVGAMLACEIGVVGSPAVSRLVLIDPVGLWRDDLPVRNWMLVPEADRASTFFADPLGSAAQRFFSVPHEAAARAEAQASFIWSQACTGKFVWPIPDKGLKNRIHRIVTPTLIVWGARDDVVSPEYASEFGRRIPGARVELIEQAGHLAHLEQGATVAEVVRSFVSHTDRNA